MDRTLILQELEKLSRAIGVPLQESRLAQYVEDLSGLDEKVFVDVCNELRLSWEKTSFPPVGVFLNKAREKRRYQYEQKPVSRVVIDESLIEAARRQDEYLKMSHEEYMAMCIQIVKQRSV